MLSIGRGGWLPALLMLFQAVLGPLLDCVLAMYISYEPQSSQNTGLGQPRLTAYGESSSKYPPEDSNHAAATNSSHSLSINGEMETCTHSYPKTGLSR